MNQTPRLARASVVAAFAIVASAWGSGRANAETIDLFTGSWQLISPYDGAGFQRQSISNLSGLISPDFTGYFFFGGSIGNYSEQGSGCTPFGAPCVVTWSGVFSGGTVSFGACCGQAGLSDYSFTGRITDGSFEGAVFCDFDECLGENRAFFSFVSTSTRVVTFEPRVVLNAWNSQGTFSVQGCVGNCGPWSVGTLTMTTSTVPEPGSMALLGAGIGAFAVRQRQKRSKQTS